MILNALSALYLDSVSIHLHDCAVAFLGSETIQRSQQVLIDTYLDKYLLIIILCHFFLLFFLSFFFLHNLWIWLAFFMTGLNRWLLHSKNNHYLWLCAVWWCFLHTCLLKYLILSGFWGVRKWFAGMGKASIIIITRAHTHTVWPWLFSTSITNTSNHWRNVQCNYDYFTSITNTISWASINNPAKESSAITLKLGQGYQTKMNGYMNIYYI